MIVEKGKGEFKDKVNDEYENEDGISDDEQRSKYVEGKMKMKVLSSKSERLNSSEVDNDNKDDEENQETRTQVNGKERSKSSCCRSNENDFVSVCGQLQSNNNSKSTIVPPRSNENKSVSVCGQLQSNNNSKRRKKHRGGAGVKKSADETFSIFFQNIRGHNSKEYSLRKLMKRIKPSVVALNETQLAGNAKINITPYTWWTKNRNKKGGGVATGVAQEQLEREECGNLKRKSWEAKRAPSRPLQLLIQAQERWQSQNKRSKM